MTERKIEYNLWTENWIPVIMNDGNRRELGIFELLKNAHNIKEIHDENPIFEISMFRLLVAIVMDAYNLDSTERIIEVLNEKQFDSVRLEEYKGIYLENFDLFGEDVRFYQKSSATGFERKDKKSVAEIIIDYPSGSNSILFRRKSEKHLKISPKVCAKGLCVAATYSTASGRGYQPSVAGTPPIYTLIIGNTLFETLLYNSCPDSLLGNPSDVGPAWTVQEEIGKSKYMVEKISTTLGLTWQGRSFFLIPEILDSDYTVPCDYTGERTSIFVSSIYLTPGWLYKKDREYRDPHCTYVQNRAVQLKEDRSFWRSIGPLYLATDSEKEKRSAVIDQYVKFMMRGPISRVKFLSYAMITDGRAKIFLWAREPFTLPREILQDVNKANFLMESLNDAETVGNSLRYSIMAMDPESKEENKRKALGTMRKEILKRYWNASEITFKQQLIREVKESPLESEQDKDKLKYFWIKKLSRIAWKEFLLLENLISQPKHYKDFHRANKILNYQIYDKFPILMKIERPEEYLQQQRAKEEKEQRKVSKKSSKAKKTTEQRQDEAEPEEQVDSNVSGVTLTVKQKKTKQTKKK